MAVSIVVDGVPVTHYPYGAVSAFKPVAGAEPGVFTFSVGDSFEVVKEDKVTPMVPRAEATGDPLPLVTVSPGALWLSAFLPELEGFARVNGGEWFPITSDDVPDLLAQLDVLAQRAANAETSAAAALTAAQTSAQDAAQARADVDAFIASGGGGGGAGFVTVPSEADALAQPEGTVVILLGQA